MSQSDELVNLIADWMAACAAMDPTIIPALLKHVKTEPECRFKEAVCKARAKTSPHIESLREILFLMLTSKVFHMEDVVRAWELAVDDYAHHISIK